MQKTEINLRGKIEAKQNEMWTIFLLHESGNFRWGHTINKKHATHIFPRLYSHTAFERIPVIIFNTVCKILLQIKFNRIYYCHLDYQVALNMRVHRCINKRKSNCYSFTPTHNVQYLWQSVMSSVFYKYISLLTFFIILSRSVIKKYYNTNKLI